LGGHKPSEIWCDFAQLHTLIANISGTDEVIDKPKTALLTAIPPTFNKKIGEVPQTEKL